MASKRSHLHPLFRTAWYEKGAVRTPAYLRQLLDLRAALSRRELRLLLQDNIAFPREYRITPAEDEFAYDIAQSRLPTAEWFKRHPDALRVVEQALSQYWDETGDKFRKEGMRIIESPEVMRARQKRRATGCSTLGYDPTRELSGDVPRSVITRHRKRLPQWLPEGGTFTTSTSRYGDVVTSCSKGRLRTVVR